jgi:hypothetical protein
MIGLRMAATALAQTKSLHGVEPWLRGLLDRHDHIVLLCVGPYLSVFVVGHGTALADLPPPSRRASLGREHLHHYVRKLHACGGSYAAASGASHYTSCALASSPRRARGCC